jgi:hypothetical protein
MSRKPIIEGQRVELATGDEFNGLKGTVERVFKSRGEPPVYSVRVDGHSREPLSFVGDEARRAGP